MGTKWGSDQFHSACGVAPILSRTFCHLLNWSGSAFPCESMKQIRQPCFKLLGRGIILSLLLCHLLLFLLPILRFCHRVNETRCFNVTSRSPLSQAWRRFRWFWTRRLRGSGKWRPSTWATWKMSARTKRTARFSRTWRIRRSAEWSWTVNKTKWKISWTRSFLHLCYWTFKLLFEGLSSDTTKINHPLRFKNTLQLSAGASSQTHFVTRSNSHKHPIQNLTLRWHTKI